jgi:hypothetical protein
MTYFLNQWKIGSVDFAYFKIFLHVIISPFGTEEFKATHKIAFCLIVLFTRGISQEFSTFDFGPVILSRGNISCSFKQRKLINQVAAVIALKIAFVVFHLIAFNYPNVILSFTVHEGLVHLIFYQFGSIFRKEIFDV